MLRRSLPVALTCLVLLPAAAPAPARGPAARETKAPRWDARGVGLLAWQGVACLDVNHEATRLALGTIAPGPARQQEGARGRSGPRGVSGAE